LGFRVALIKVSIRCSRSSDQRLPASAYRYARRDFRLTDVHGEVVKAILA
jgi:hypothetical protein